MWTEEKGKWMRTSMPTEKHNKKIKNNNNKFFKKAYGIKIR